MKFPGNLLLNLNIRFALKINHPELAKINQLSIRMWVPRVYEGFCLTSIYRWLEELNRKFAEESQIHIRWLAGWRVSELATHEAYNFLACEMIDSHK